MLAFLTSPATLEIELGGKTHSRQADKGVTSFKVPLAPGKPLFRIVRDGRVVGYLLGALRGEDAPGRLRLAVAYGSAAAGLPGTTIPTPDHVTPELVKVAELPVPTTT